MPTSTWLEATPEARSSSPYLKQDHLLYMNFSLVIFFDFGNYAVYAC